MPAGIIIISNIVAAILAVGVSIPTLAFPLLLIYILP
jgi:hypothetical protein